LCAGHEGAHAVAWRDGVEGFVFQWGDAIGPSVRPDEDQVAGWYCKHCDWDVALG
jgi:hypothetical protein